MSSLFQQCADIYVGEAILFGWSQNNKDNEEFHGWQTKLVNICDVFDLGIA